MDFSQLSDDAVVAEIGARIRVARLDQNLSQAELAATAGLSRRTVANAEKGEGGTVGTLVALLRALGHLDALVAFLPAGGPSPVQLAKTAGVPRRRAGRTATSEPQGSAWSWGDEQT